MSLFVAFVFVGGPLIFRLLLWMDLELRFLGISAVALMGVAIGLRYGFDALWGADLWVTLTVLTLIWVAWVVVLVLSAQALWRVMPELHMRRWTSVFGMASTTVPWFGLAFAHWIEG